MGSVGENESINSVYTGYPSNRVYARVRPEASCIFGACGPKTVFGRHEGLESEVDDPQPSVPGRRTMLSQKG